MTARVARGLSAALALDPMRERLLRGRRSTTRQMNDIVGPRTVIFNSPVSSSQETTESRPPCCAAGRQSAAVVRDASRHNVAWLQLHALAYNLANFMRTLALPQGVEQWSLTTLREKLVKFGAKIVRHGRYVVFQLAEVAVPRALFADILRRIDGLRPKPPPLAA